MHDERPVPKALLTDLYQLTMAYGYWRSGRAQQQAAFHLFFRKQPFDGGFSICCGLADALAYLEHFRFAPEDLAFLSTLRGNDGRALFERAFLDFLGEFELALDLDAIPEGTAVFPHEPLVRVQGPILQAQLVETALLNIVNFQTLIATKAARVCLAAEGDPVIEFGLRRAQGVDGTLSASRAAYVGGCDGTSNVLAGKVFNIPVKGTHAHSWVMSFGSELEAFRQYAEALPNNCVFLVDTYDSLEGVRHAATVGTELAKRGHKLAGIRLDSGDLAYLSIEARKILDAAGFRDAAIMASNDLNEHIIASLKRQGARIDVWGVGTQLVTAYDQPALGGVYKLGAVRDETGAWDYKLKLSDQAAKTTNPGILQVRRFRHDRAFVGDVIYDEIRELPERITIVDPRDPTRRKHIEPGTPSEELLTPVVRAGKVTYASPSLDQIRKRAQEQLGMLHPGIKRFENPHAYPAGLELSLHDFKMNLMLRARGEA